MVEARTGWREYTYPMPERAPQRDPRFKGKRYEPRYPEGHGPPIQESLEMCAEKITELESLMESFERTYDLKALGAIAGFASREERLNSPRQQALDALLPISKLLTHLETQAAVSVEVYDALRSRYQPLLLAIGTVTTRDVPEGMIEAVDHTR